MKKLIFALLIIAAATDISAREYTTGQFQNPEINKQSAQQRQIATLKNASRLFADKMDLTSVILIIPADSVADVISTDSTYLKVAYNDYEGYIFRRDAILSNAPAEPAAAAGQNSDQQVDQNAQSQKVSRFTYLENKYGTNMAARLAAGKIWKGMSAEMVMDSWGKPQKINRIMGDVIKEEWIYRNTWLYIENNTLVEWGPTER